MDALLTEHFDYLADAVKLRQYREVIVRVVRPGDTVLDLGCGSGVLGLMALRAGAGHVHFVDETGALELARRALVEAGYGDRASFHSGNSHELSLPERVDVVLCDHVGYFGLDYDVLRLLDDARERFLKPGGTLIPEALRLEVAAVSSEHCRSLVSRWRDGSIPSEFTWIAEVEANVKHGVHLEADDLISDPVTLGTVSLLECAAPFLSWTVELECARDGLLDGIAGWFNCRLVEGVSMTNSPLADERLQRSQVFLGLEYPVPVRKGECLLVTVMARHAENVLGWVIEQPASGERYSHSTWNALLLDREHLTRARSERIATLNGRGRARQVVHSYCDGVRSVAEVEAAVLRYHPDLLPSTEAIRAFVRRVLGKDTGS